ncbi:WYL domain-containing protein [Pseudomonas aeruginosa]|nr:WYL domain-containing protein [Pseudomonas aeruginosa]
MGSHQVLASCAYDLPVHGTPEPHSREISPHSLVRAGRRWHVRAFCSTRQEFRDYALGRIENPKIADDASERSAIEDRAWNTLLDVRLIAHPALSNEQQRVVSLEYFANTSARVERCRAALVSYFVQDVRAATDVVRQSPPSSS